MSTYTYTNVGSTSGNIVFTSTNATDATAWRADASETIDGWLPLIRLGKKIVWQGDPIKPTKKHPIPERRAKNVAQARIDRKLSNLFGGK